MIRQLFSEFIHKILDLTKNRPIFGFLLFILILLFAGLIYFEILRPFNNIRYKGGLERLKSTKNIKVYDFEGKEIGKILEVYLMNHKIYGWLIKVNSETKRKIGKKKLLINQRHVSSIRDVMILDEKASTHIKDYAVNKNGSGVC